MRNEVIQWTQWTLTLKKVHKPKYQQNQSDNRIGNAAVYLIRCRGMRPKLWIRHTFNERALNLIHSLPKMPYNNYYWHTEFQDIELAQPTIEYIKKRTNPRKRE